MSVPSETALDNQNSLHNKLYKIQSEIGSLFRTQENRFQKYKYFNEEQCLELLKPLLDKYKVAIYFSDDILLEREGDKQFFIGDMFFRKEEKEWVVKYLKKAEIVNIQDKITPRDLVNSTQSDLINYRVSEEKITFRFWAIGSNTDPAKAKGSAETYALKYFLSKFFLIPVKDENDPDSGNKEVEKIVESNRRLTKDERLQTDKLLENHGFRTVFAKVRQSLKVDEEERQEAKILQKRKKERAEISELLKNVKKEPCVFCKKEDETVKARFQFAALEEVKEAFNALGEILAANGISINLEFKDLDNKKVQEEVIEKLKEKNGAAAYFLKDDGKIEVGFNNHPEGIKAVVVDTEALLNNSPPHEVSGKETKEKVKKEIVPSDSKKSQVADETTCDRCNENINDCKCFNQKAVKPNKLQETETPTEPAQEKDQEKEVAKITGKINNTPQMGSDASGNTYYLANFTDQDSFTFPIYLWEKPVLTKKQKHRKQYWSTLIESFRKLAPETSITIEGYH
ncbi:33652_t:CDS:2 [Gigaspora margarita]|uniref:33652_t:CDS:1 n=1 Tax=Gigaspora margarita TaxID=4874 RepID=A0ABM8VXL5_GIGMA|nr:33652_t:CDS:2 [Gigaspora margarita]